MPALQSTVWRRTGESRRLLVVEYADGTIEDLGFVPVVGLVRVAGDDVRSAIEWKDAEGVPHTAMLSSEDYGEDGQLLSSHIVPVEDGTTQLWHFDDAALAKIRRDA